MPKLAGSTIAARKRNRAFFLLGLPCLAILFFPACGGNRGGGGGSGCGDGLVDSYEECDGNNLGGLTCKTIPSAHYVGGTLSCTRQCTLDVSRCQDPPPENCTDGKDNDGDSLIDCDDTDCDSNASCSLTGGMGGQGGAGGADGSGEGGMGGAEPSNGGAPQAVGGTGDPGVGGEGGATSVVTAKLIYHTAMPKKSNFGGISAADALCNASPPRPGTYKALLVDGTTRQACTTANCGGGATEHVDWVLAPDTEYSRPDGTLIGTTNGDGIFVFPLQAEIAHGYTYWTGLTGDWTNSSDDCSDWTQTVGYFANEGNGDVTTSDAIAGVNESCASLAGAFFACVEQ